MQFNGAFVVYDKIKIFLLEVNNDWARVPLGSQLEASMAF